MDTLRRFAVRAFIACVGIAAALAQAPRQGGASFEVASVRVASASGEEQRRIPIGARVEGTLVHISRLTVGDLISLSYRVKNYQIAAPDWTRAPYGTRFDIEARMPEGSTKEQMPDMLQKLLADRFGLITHKESRDMPVWVLIVSRNGPELEPAVSQPPQPVSVKMINPDLMRRIWYRITLKELCANLTNMFQRPVIDETGITGEYQIAIDFAVHEMASAQGVRPPSTGQPDGAAAEPSGTPALFQSIGQLGLRLESKKAPVEMIVVDHIEKVPTEN